MLVVGAGPAGATAATLLARAGRSVLLVDKAVFPRDKCCGDGLTTLALRELEALGLRPEQVPNWQTVDAAWLRSPSGREVCLPMPADGIYAATTPRRELDAALRAARTRGGRRRPRRARAHRRRASSAIASRPTSTASARWRPASSSPPTACGRPPASCSDLAEPGYLGEWHAFRQYARNVTGPAAERLYVWFEPDFLPGYAWSFPLPDGRVNIGFGVLRDGTRTGKAMKADWAGLIDRPHIRAALGPDVELEDRHTAWPIPAGIDRAVLTAGRTLFVGDAARATDVMTGEGIGQAVLTGRLAAEAVLAADATDATRARRVRDAPSATTCSPTTACRRCSTAGSPGRCSPAARSGSSASTAGPAATSCAGCSRTNPAPSCSPPGAGTAASSASTAPTADPGPARPIRVPRHRPSATAAHPSATAPCEWVLATRGASTPLGSTARRTRGVTARLDTGRPSSSHSPSRSSRSSSVTRSTCQSIRWTTGRAACPRSSPSSSRWFGMDIDLHRPPHRRHGHVQTDPTGRSAAAESATCATTGTPLPTQPVGDLHLRMRLGGKPVPRGSAASP